MSIKRSGEQGDQQGDVLRKQVVPAYACRYGALYRSCEQPDDTLDGCSYRGVPPASDLPGLDEGCSKNDAVGDEIKQVDKCMRIVTGTRGFGLKFFQALLQ